MDMENTFQKLTELFASNINYDGEFNSLFFIEKEQEKLKITFLNKQHHDYILRYLIHEILKVTGKNVIFDHLNLKTSDITLKNHITDEVKTSIKPVKIKAKEKVQLPTIKNRTIQQIEEFMSCESKRILKEQEEIREQKENYLESISYASNYGQITFIVNLYHWMQKIKDYEED